jgi:three-Cys-motif partner protein
MYKYNHCARHFTALFERGFVNYQSFFNEPKQQSLVKAKIVSQYFWAWAKIITPNVKRSSTENRIAYVDLFAGAGRYKTGDPSTPLLILQRAVDEPDICRLLSAVFNDKDPLLATKLQQEIDAFPNVERLKFKPIVRNDEVNSQLAQQIASRAKRPPTLTFLDPCGYKGLSIQLIEAVTKHWGCECIFFFNYNRINPALNNETVSELMDELFGEDNANTLRAKLNNLSPDQRENLIVEELLHILRQNNKLVSMFRFTTPTGQRTSHYLVFVTKHPRGHSIMKEIMAKHSSQSIQGVASFEFNPQRERQPMLIEISTPIDDLSKTLLKDFAGQKLTMREVYELHNIGKPFIESNYKHALLQLERGGRIVAIPSKRRPNTFADHVIVIFPDI